jgi:5-methylthioadenosine/S-adenosylhomocysteine deaminase
MLEHGLSVSLGADGAACNNRLDMFTEMRTAALLQKVRHGPDVLPAARVLRMATIDGARALGLESEIGSLEVGKRGDVAIVRMGEVHLTPGVDIVSTLVYSGQPSDVECVLIDGELVLQEGKLSKIDEAAVVSEATHEFSALTSRAGFGTAKEGKREKKALKKAVPARR